MSKFYTDVDIYDPEITAVEKADRAYEQFINLEHKDLDSLAFKAKRVLKFYEEAGVDYDTIPAVHRREMNRVFMEACKKIGDQNVAELEKAITSRSHVYDVFIEKYVKDATTAYGSIGLTEDSPEMTKLGEVQKAAYRDVAEKRLVELENMTFAPSLYEGETLSDYTRSLRDMFTRGGAEITDALNDRIQASEDRFGPDGRPLYYPRDSHAYQTELIDKAKRILSKVQPGEEIPEFKPENAYEAHAFFAENLKAAYPQVGNRSSYRLEHAVQNSKSLSLDEIQDLAADATRIFDILKLPADSVERLKLASAAEAVYSKNHELYKKAEKLISSMQPGETAPPFEPKDDYEAGDIFAKALKAAYVRVGADMTGKLGGGRYARALDLSEVEEFSSMAARALDAGGIPADGPERKELAQKEAAAYLKNANDRLFEIEYKVIMFEEGETVASRMQSIKDAHVRGGGVVDEEFEKRFQAAEEKLAAKLAPASPAGTAQTQKMKM